MNGLLADADAAYSRGDYVNALRISRPLASLDYAAAQNNLGFMYANGQGFTRDYQKAAMWFLIAESSGHPDTAKPLKKATAEISENDLVVARRWAKTCIKREFQNCE